MGSTTSPPPKHHIVCLDECHCAIPKFDLDYTYKGYWTTLPTQVPSRIHDATIVIASICPVTPAHMDTAPSVNLLAIMATGMEWVDKAFCADRGITVINCPQGNVLAVGEHTLGLYVAARKKMVEMHMRTVGSDEWVERGTLTKRFGNVPLGLSQEVVGVVGFGALGKRMEALFGALGVRQVLVAERKGVKDDDVRVMRVSFEEVLKKASVILLCCPKDPSTINLIGETALRTMREDTCLSNVSRGGGVNEAALARALREGWIESAATDVLEVEPGRRGKSPLLPSEGEEPVPNLTISPHIAWFTQESILTLQKLLKDGIEQWAIGKPINIAVHEGKIYK